MDLAHRILERIHEVELQVAPEFQKPYPEPEITRGIKGEVTWDFGEGSTIIGRFTRNELDIDASISSLFVPTEPWPRVRHGFAWIKDHLTDFASEGLLIYIEKVGPEEKEYAHRLLLEGIIDGFVMTGDEKTERDEGTLDEPEVRTDNVHTWWNFGGALTLVGKIYPSQKRVDILGHASSLEARMDELMKMFSWLSDNNVGYYITVHGGNAKREDMVDLVNAGMISKFVPETKDERGGPFVVEKHTPLGIYHDENRFETIEEAKSAARAWKKRGVEEYKDTEGFDPDDFTWVVMNAEGEKVAEEG